MFQYVSLLFKAFYDKKAVRNYVIDGGGIGLVPFFVLAVMSAGVFVVKSAVFMPPETFDSASVSQMPELHIGNARIVSPDGFFKRFKINDVLNLTLDTTEDEEAPEEKPLSAQIRIAKNAVYFETGQKFFLSSVANFFGSDSLIVASKDVPNFLSAGMRNLFWSLPFFIFPVTLLAVFFKFVLAGYVVALASYAVTVFSKTPVSFERRMRLAAVSVLPAFVFNFVFGTVAGIFVLGMSGAAVLSLVYLFYYAEKVFKNA